MPTFTVRRRKPKIVTPPPSEAEPEVNIEEKESDEDLISESSDTSDYLNEAFKAMEVDKKRPLTKQVRFEDPKPTIKRPPKQYVTHVAPERRENVQYLPPRTPQTHLNDPFLRKPTMRNPYMRPPKDGGGAKFRYRSHYGLEGEHLDTRVKTNLLYHHCFK